MKKKKNEYVSWSERKIKTSRDALRWSLVSLGCATAALIITILRLT